MTLSRAPVTLSHWRDVAVAAERTGAVTLAWLDERPAVVEAATWSSMGGFSRARVISPTPPGDQVSDLGLIALPGGGSAVSWADRCLGYGTLVAALRRRGRGFSAAERVASIGRGAPYALAAGGGRIGAVWSRPIWSQALPEATLRTLPGQARR